MDIDVCRGVRLSLEERVRVSCTSLAAADAVDVAGLEPRKDVVAAWDLVVRGRRRERRERLGRSKGGEHLKDCIRNW